MDAQQIGKIVAWTGTIALLGAPVVGLTTVVLAKRAIAHNKSTDTHKKIAKSVPWVMGGGILLIVAGNLIYHKL